MKSQTEHREARLARVEDAPHGTYSGYINWNCRCVDCCRAGRLYARARREGTGTPRVDSREAAQHLRFLLVRGFTYRQLKTIVRADVSRIATGQYRKIRRDTSERILAVHLGRLNDGR